MLAGANWPRPPGGCCWKCGNSANVRRQGSRPMPGDGDCGNRFLCEAIRHLRPDDGGGGPALPKRKRTIRRASGKAGLDCRSGPMAPVNTARPAATGGVHVGAGGGWCRPASGDGSRCRVSIAAWCSLGPAASLAADGRAGRASSSAAPGLTPEAEAVAADANPAGNLIPMGTAGGAKATATAVVRRRRQRATLHSPIRTPGGQYEWDSSPPVAVGAAARSALLTASTVAPVGLQSGGYLTCRILLISAAARMGPDLLLAEVPRIMRSD